jgi:hypothetical protein
MWTSYLLKVIFTVIGFTVGVFFGGLLILFILWLFFYVVEITKIR